MSALRHPHLKKLVVLSLVAVLALANVGCFVQKHDVGQGATGGEEREFNQWFILWGLVPITQIEDDVESAYAGATDYTVTSQFTPLDCVINFFTSFVTIYRKSITVER